LPQRQPKARLRIEEGNCPALEFDAHDAFGFQARTAPTEARRTRKVAHHMRNQEGARLHDARLVALTRRPIAGRFGATRRKGPAIEQRPPVSTPAFRLRRIVRALAPEP
jgi:hypothetical protein